MTKPLPHALLLDTNVWIDNYVGTRAACNNSRALIDTCNQLGIPLLISITSLKDVYYLICLELKHESRNREETVSNGCAIEEIAWKFVQNAATLATIVPADTSDFHVARYFHELHKDLEDDLILAAMERSGADYLVTNDKKLLLHAPVAAVNPGDMLTLLKAFIA